MECVHKVLAYPHLVDFFIFFVPFSKARFLFMKDRPNLIKPQGCCFSQTALLHRSVMQTIQFLQCESCTGM